MVRKVVKLSASVVRLYRQGWCCALACTRTVYGGARDHRCRVGDLADDGGLDSFKWRLVWPLGFRDCGRHLVQWRLLDYVSRSEEPAGARVPTCSAVPK